MRITLFVAIVTSNPLLAAQYHTVSMTKSRRLKPSSSSKKPLSSSDRLFQGAVYGAVYGYCLIKFFLAAHVIIDFCFLHID